MQQKYCNQLELIERCEALISGTISHCTWRQNKRVDNTLFDVKTKYGGNVRLTHVCITIMSKAHKTL